MNRGGDALCYTLLYLENKGGTAQAHNRRKNLIFLVHTRFSETHGQGDYGTEAHWTHCRGAVPPPHGLKIFRGGGGGKKNVY